VWFFWQTTKSASWAKECEFEQFSFKGLFFLKFICAGMEEEVAPPRTRRFAMFFKSCSTEAPMRDPTAASLQLFNGSVLTRLLPRWNSAHRERLLDGCIKLVKLLTGKCHLWRERLKK
jgi:hypothetical protein